MSCSLGVCNLVHTCIGHDLQLSSSCSVLISLPSQEPFIDDGNRKIDSIAYRDLWISPNGGFGIEFELRFESVMSDITHRKAFVEDLGGMLRDAEVDCQQGVIGATVD
jgi:hypothetical protein